MIKVSVSFTEPMLDRLQALAAEGGRSVSDLVFEVVSNWLGRN